MSDSNEELSGKLITSEGQGPTLSAPHTCKEWEEDDAKFRCVLCVQLPNGATRSFGGTGDSAKSARISATFRASFEMNMLTMKGALSDDSSDSSSSDDTDGSNIDAQKRDRKLANGVRGPVVDQMERDDAAFASPVTGTKSSSSASSSSISNAKVDDKGHWEGREKAAMTAPGSEQIVFVSSSEQSARHDGQESEYEVEVVTGFAEAVDGHISKVANDMLAEASKPSCSQSNPHLEYSSPSEGEVLEVSTDMEGSALGQGFKYMGNPGHKRKKGSAASPRIIIPQRTSPAGRTSTLHGMEDSAVFSEVPHAPFARVRGAKGMMKSASSASLTQANQKGIVVASRKQRRNERSSSASSKSRKVRKTLLVSPSTSPLRRPKSDPDVCHITLPVTSPHLGNGRNENDPSRSCNSAPIMSAEYNGGGPAPMQRLKAPSATPLPLPCHHRNPQQNTTGALYSPSMNYSNRMPQSNSQAPVPMHGQYGTGVPQMSLGEMQTLSAPYHSQFMGSAYGAAGPNAHYMHPPHPSMPVQSQLSHYPLGPPHATPPYNHSSIAPGNHHLPHHGTPGPETAGLAPHPVYVSHGSHIAYRPTAMHSSVLGEYEHLNVPHPRPQFSNSAPHPSMPCGAPPSQDPVPSLDEYKELVGRIARQAAIKDAQQNAVSEEHPSQIDSRMSADEDPLPSHLAKATITPAPSSPARASLSPISSEDEGDGQDHISALHMMAQKHRRLGSVKYRYKSVVKDNGTSNRWACIVKIELLGSGKEERVLRTKAEGRNKIKAKQRAASKAITSFKDMEEGACDAEACGRGTEQRESSPGGEKGNGICNAFGALIQLWHLNVLKYKPDFGFSEVGEFEGGQWKSTVTLHVEGKAMITLHETAATKKAAKAAVAQKAFEHLKNLKVPYIDSFTNVKSQPRKIPSTFDGGQQKEELENPTEQREEPSIEAVRISDDEKCDSDNGREAPAIGTNNFVMPENYELLIASSVTQVEDWVSRHVTSESELGLFVDSIDARASFENIEDPAEHERSNPKMLQRPIICLSTEHSGLVLRADTCRDPNEVTKKLTDNFWIPEVIESVLSDAGIGKCGYGIDLGVMRLSKSTNSKVQGMLDIAVASTSTNGLGSAATMNVLPSLSELITYWLKKDFLGTTGDGVWGSVAGAPTQLMSPKSEEDRVTGIAVLSAYACICIEEKIRLTCERKRQRLQNVSEEFLELSRRILYNPFA